MKGENKNKTLENKLILLKEKDRDEIPTEIFRFWQLLQRDFRLKSLVLIDFQAKNSEHNYWKWHLSYPTALIANNNLKTAFLSPTMVPTNWIDELKKFISRKGFFIPQKDILNFGNILLQDYLIFYQKLQSDFQFEKHLESVQHKKHHLKSKNIPVPIIAIATHFHFYILFLKEIFQTDFHAVKSFRKILNQPISLADFNEKLPSEQLILMFYDIANQHFCETFNESFFQKIINKSTIEIQRFWKKRKQYFFDYFEKIFSSKPNKKQFDLFSSAEIEEDFYAICLTDLELIQFQEIMDNGSEKKIYTTFFKRI